MIITAAFEAHQFKDVSRSQMASATKSICPLSVRKTLKGADKTSLMLPLAAALAANNKVEVRSGANLSNLSRGDATKVGTL